MMNRTICFVFSAGFLLLGVTIYVFFNHAPFFMRVFPEFINNIPTVETGCFFKKLLANQGADFCWAVSFAFAVQCVCRLEGRKTVYLLLCAVLGASYELFQLVGIFSGVFDTFDIVAYIAGSLFTVLINMKWRKTHEKE